MKLKKELINQHKSEKKFRENENIKNKEEMKKYDLKEWRYKKIEKRRSLKKKKTKNSKKNFAEVEGNEENCIKILRKIRITQQKSEKKVRKNEDTEKIWRKMF